MMTVDGQEKTKFGQTSGEMEVREGINKKKYVLVDK